MSDPARAPSAPAAEEDELCRRLQPALWAVAVRKARDRDLAWDLTQEALAQTLVAVRAGRIQDPDRLGAYALTILRNLAADEVRTRMRRRRLLEAQPTEPAVFGEPPGLDRERLFSCLHQLEYRARVVLVATFFEERATADIAAQLGLMEGNLRVIRHRALARLRACMEDPCS